MRAADSVRKPCYGFHPLWKEQGGMEQGWSVIIPYYNEAECLSACLDSLTQQKLRPKRVILINNASTDTSPELVRAFAEYFGKRCDVVLADEPRPGKINALVHGVRLVRTEYFATWDADTVYPPDYLQEADRAYRRGKGRYAAVMATDLYTPLFAFKTLVRRIGIQLLSRLFRSECHAGGHSETFNTRFFQQAGGFDAERWPYVLEDHEIVEAVRKVGKVVYPWGLCFRPSKRRAGEHKQVSWTKKEKRLYRFTPAFLKSWFFYRYLAPRLKARGLFSDKLRQRSWEGRGEGYKRQGG